MKRLNACETVRMALALVCLAAVPVRADLMPHTEARVSANVRSSELYDQRETGQDSVAIGPLSGTITPGNETYSATGYAETNAVGGSFMKLSATSYSTSASALRGQVNSVASAAWQDVVTLSQEVGQPDAIRLQFTIEGGLAAERFREGSGYSAGLAGLGINFFSTPGLNTYGSESNTDVRFDDIYLRLYETSSNNQPGFTHQGLASLAGGPGGFTAAFYYDAPFDADLGGYFWNMSVVADSFAGEGSSAALFGNTIKLTAVTKTNGDRFDAGDVSFESGLRLTAVPEPGGLLLASSGVLLVGLYLRRSRRRETPGNPC
jgi:hypothetical protein